jgi:hypothetical protein
MPAKLSDLGSTAGGSRQGGGSTTSRPRYGPGPIGPQVASGVARTSSTDTTLSKPTRLAILDTEAKNNPPDRNSVDEDLGGWLSSRSRARPHTNQPGSGARSSTRSAT